VEKLHQDAAEEAAETNRQLREGVFDAIASGRDKLLPPKPQQVPPALDFQALRAAAGKLTRSAQAYDAAAAGAPASSARAVNEKLIRSERLLTRAEGLPARPWFRHQIYAPGFYTGYGVKTLPGIREAIEQKRWEQARAEIARVAAVLEEQALLVDSATAELRR
jgi:N-acetylated-alpha-linked acidic dipeptidase